MIAALYVSPKGSYINVPGVDPWPEDRDARLYRGPHPVVAHPPCQRWGKFWAGQPLFIKQTGIRKIKGLDPAIVERMGFKRAQRLGEVGGRGGGKDSAPRIGTPLPFRELLLSIARTAASEFAEAAE